MNKTYRIKYNQHTGTYVAVAEISTARGKSGSNRRVVAAAIVAAGLSLFSGTASADVWGDSGVSAPGVSEGVAIGPYGCNVAASSQTVFDENGNPFQKTYAANSNHEGAWLEGNGGVVLGGGCENIAVALENGTAIGNGAAAANSAVAIGTLALAQQANAIAVGSYAQALGASSIALGTDIIANGAGSMALGTESHAEGVVSLALGVESHAEGRASMALGVESHAKGDASLAVGAGAHANGVISMAMGVNSYAEGALLHK